MPKAHKSRPYLLSGETARMMRSDLLIALLPLILLATVLNGFRVLFLCAVAAVAAWGAETAATLLFAKRRSLPVSTPISTGLMIALVCPLTVPWWLVASGGVFAVLAGRILQKRLARPLFQPAALGWLFMLLIAPRLMTTYPYVGLFNHFPVFGSGSNFTMVPSLAQLLGSQIKPPYDAAQLIIGKLAGGMGTTCLLVIAASTIYLFYRRANAWQVTASMAVVAAVMAAFIDRAHAGVVHSIVYELSASSFLFAAVYLAADPAVAPRMPFGRVMYGAFCGLLVMALRFIGLAESSVVLAVLAVSPLSASADRLALYVRNDRPSPAKHHSGETREDQPSPGPASVFFRRIQMLFKHKEPQHEEK